MSDDLYLIKGSTLTDIADALREKTGYTSDVSKYHGFDFASAIRNLQTSSGSITTESNVVSGEFFNEASSHTVGFECSFAPSKLILYTSVTEYANDIFAFIYDSSETACYTYYIVNDSNKCVKYEGNANSTFYFVEYDDGIVTIGTSDDMNHMFAANNWHYIAIA